MKRFAALYQALDSTTSTLAKTRALETYFQSVSAADAAWAVYFLTGNKPRQAVPVRRLAAWAAQEAGIPLWLFEESYDAVGDLAETIALVLPPPTHRCDLPLAEWVETRLLRLRERDESEQRAALLAYWRELTTNERLVWNKLITSAFRVGVSRQLVVRALSRVAQIDAKTIAHRLAGDWTPSAQAYEALLAPESRVAVAASKPYPFFLAHPLEGDTEALGDVSEWQAEWKWDGIRAQLIRRGDATLLWSRGDELITEQFPEIIAAARVLPDCVLDGEVLPWKEGRVRAFNMLQKRLGRKNPGKKILTDVPTIFLAYDLLELAGEDWRARPLRERRAALYQLCIDHPAWPTVQLSETIRAPAWEVLHQAREQSRERGVEGLMLKRLASAYGVGRTRGDWWKWKIAPYTVDAVLIYAQRGHGKRASLYTDYTFGVWSEREGKRELVPFAKAYSGLTDEEIARVDAFIRKNTLEKFGPVRTVKPELVFELAFEGLQRSTRHKSGVATRFPRIARWRTDKKIDDADTLATIHALLERT